MTDNFFLATVASFVLYCLSWVLFFVSIPDKSIEAPEDVPFMMVIGFFGKTILGWATTVLGALTAASFISTLL